MTGLRSPVFLGTKNSVEINSPLTWLVFITAPLDSNLSTSAAINAVSKSDKGLRFGGANCHGRDSNSRR